MASIRQAHPRPARRSGGLREARHRMLAAFDKHDRFKYNNHQLSKGTARSAEAKIEGTAYDQVQSMRRQAAHERYRRRRDL